GHAALRARGRRPELAVHPAPCLDRRARRRLGLHRRLAALTPRPGPPHRARMTDPLAILYADAHIAVVDKPAGVIVHESRLAGAETDTLVARVRAELGRPAWLAHRLDRATSGCLLLGLDRALMASLGAGFMERQVDKRYLAVVRGWPEPEGVIDHPLDGGPGKPDRRPAITRYRVLA